MSIPDVAGLRQRFLQFWKEIKGAQLYAGQPRNEQSSAGVKRAREALRLATEAGDEELLMDAWRMLYYSLTANEQYVEAIPYCEKAIAAYEARGEHALASRIRIGYVFALTHADRYTEALSAARTAEIEFKSTGDDAGYARLCTNVASLYQRLDKYQESYRYYNLAAGIFESSGDLQACAQVYQNLGYTLARIDRFEDAQRMYERARGLSATLGLRELAAQASYNSAYLLFLRGRFTEALRSFARIKTHFKQSGSLRHVALCDLDQAEIYLHLNMFSDAASLARTANEQFASLEMIYEEAKASAFYGVAQLQMRELEEAMTTFVGAQERFDRQGNLYWSAVLDLYQANTLIELRRLPEAEERARKAVDRFKTLQVASRRMLSQAVLGRIALLQGHTDEAEECANAIESFASQATSAFVRFPYLILKGRIAEARSDWKAARGAYEEAAGDLEAYQVRLQQDDLRVQFLQGRNQVYESLVQIALRENEESEAYAWCERAKSRALVELLSNHLESIPIRAGSSRVEEIRKLRDELNFQYVRIRPEANAQVPPAEFEEILSRERELTRTLREAALTDPEGVSLQQVSSVNLETVQEFMPARTTILEYFVAGDEVLVFVVPKSSAPRCIRLTTRGRIERLQEQLTFQLEAFKLGQEYVEAHAGQIRETTSFYLRELYDSVFAPSAGFVETPQITIIPHGVLHFLPFHALFDGKSYLVDRFEFAYAPSASVLRYCLDKPDVSGSSPFLMGVADEMAPMMEHEVHTLGRLFPGARVLAGSEATRTGFGGGTMNASFIHLATHATFRQDNPMFSSFKLADGYITALDLFSMNCATNLLTLSGCNSGLGEITGSDDLLGLMRGFLYAGARSLLLSLWNVSDVSTELLMREFYKEWQSGAVKTMALQTAMKRVREVYPSPYHWAPFVLVGKA